MWRDDDELFTKQEVERIVRRWGTNLRFFPADKDDRIQIGGDLIKMCEHKRALLWLEQAVISTRIWKSFGEVRGIYCSRFQPMDGIEADAYDTPGFRPVDLETRSLEAHYNAKQIAAAPVADPQADALLSEMRKRMEEKLARAVGALKPRTYEPRPPVFIGESEFAAHKTAEQKALEIAELEARLGIKDPGLRPIPERPSAQKKQRAASKKRKSRRAS